MKRLIILFLVGVSVFSYAQQTESRSVGSFRGVKVSEGIDVYLKKGDKEGVKLEVSGVSLSDVVTEVSGDYLKIHMKQGHYRDRTVKAYVTYVEISKLSASSAANIFAEGVLKATQLSIGASSAGSIDIQIDVENADISASSAGDIELKGSAKKLTVDVSSAGEVDAYDLKADFAEIEASSAGSVKLSVSKEIIAEASSGGSIRYRGSPERSNTNSSSGGSVKKSN